MQMYKVKMRVCYSYDFETHARDEDHAFDMALKEASTYGLPDNAYEVSIDSEEITEEIDEGYIDEDR